MVWTDVAFKTLTNFAVGNEENALNNHLMIEALLDGHVATQVLAIRRLMDNDNISLRHLVKDWGETSLFLHAKIMSALTACPTTTWPCDRHVFWRMPEIGERVAFWVPNSGPQGDGTSELAHKQFDKLAGIAPTKRNPDDRLPISLLRTIEKWLDDSGADDLAKWSTPILRMPADRNGGNELPILT